MTTIIFFMSVLDVRIPRILLRSVWKTTCKVQNTYNGEPFDFIFNPWNVFSGIVDRTFCFDYIYSNVLFVLNRACDKKGVRSGSGRKKKKNEATISFWWDLESVAEWFRYHIRKGGAISRQYINILHHCKITVNFSCLSLVQGLYQVIKLNVLIVTMYS